MMFAEQYGCLELPDKKNGALMIGFADPELVAYLSAQFSAVTVLDWVSERVAALAGGVSQNVKAGNVEKDLSLLPTGQFNYILIIYGSLYFPDLALLTETLTGKLEPRGRLELLEPISRPGTMGQELSAKLLKVEHLLQSHLPARSFAGDLAEPEVRLSTLQYQKNPPKYFTDPELLFSASFWQGELDRIIGKAGKQGKTVPQIKPLLREIKGLVADKQEAKTPPFTKISARLKSPAVTPVTFEKPLEPSIALPKGKGSAVSPDKSAGAKPTERVKTVFTSTETITVPALADTTANHPLYKRLLAKGIADLQTHELLTVALVNIEGEIGTEVIEQIRQTVLQDYGAKAVGDERNPAIMATHLGITIPQACRIIAIFELGRRYFEAPINGVRQINDPESAYEYLKEMADLKKEVFRGLYLNVQNYLVHDEVISIGTLVKSLVHPREVFSPAIAHSAHSLIVAHNHPSGELTPSDADINVTKQLYHSAQILGIELIDHLIISSRGFFSMKREGKFPAR